MDDPADKPTPPWGHRPSESLAAIARTTRDTSENAAKTLDKVDVLRSEMRGHLGRQDAAIEGIQGKLDILVDEIQVDRRERSEIRVSETRARIEVHKTGEIALIEDRADAAKNRRALLLKVLLVVGPIVSAVVSAILAGG